MNDSKHIGLDLHQATICAAMLDGTSKLVLECTLKTKTTTVLQFLKRLHGSLHMCLEEGTCAAWLHDLVKPHVTEVLVCDPRRNALLKAGNKNDRIDARKLGDRKAREAILNEFCLNTGYHRKYAIRLLNGASPCPEASPSGGSAKTRPELRAPNAGGFDRRVGSSGMRLVGAVEVVTADVDALDSQALPDEPRNGAGVSGHQPAADGPAAARQEATGAEELQSQSTPPLPPCCFQAAGRHGRVLLIFQRRLTRPG